jgi:hypothetical protein
VSYTSVTQLGDGCRPSGALEAFGERMSAMSGRALEVDAKMTSVLQQLGPWTAAPPERRSSPADRSHRPAARRHRGPAARAGSIEGRLERLNTISTSVDERLREQTAQCGDRRHQDQLRRARRRVSEAQARLEAVRAARRGSCP